MSDPDPAGTRGYPGDPNQADGDAPDPGRRIGRLESLALAGFCACLPAAFRPRQHDEWAGDLLDLADAGAGPSERWRYLAGAARTLPSLRRQVRRVPGIDVPVVTTTVGLPVMLARIVLYGLGWTVLAWLLAVPARYLALDVPGRIRRSGGPVDPKGLWPFDVSPTWLVPLWAIFHLTAWAVYLGGPFLLTAVTGFGGLAALRRRGNRRIAGLAVLTAVLILAGITIASMTMSMSFVGDSVGNGRDLGVLGVVAAVLGGSIRAAGRPVRIGLLVVGTAAVAIAFGMHTDAGLAMFGWFAD